MSSSQPSSSQPSSSQPKPSPFSVRPLQPPNDRKPKTLAEFITRINAQPGGFRNVRQADLQKQVDEKKQKENADDNGDIQMYDGAADEEEEPESDATKDLTAARNEVLHNIEYGSLCQFGHAACCLWLTHWY
jgi:mediator of RNA polymerase II transcription subunit 17